MIATHNSGASFRPGDYVPANVIVGRLIFIQKQGGFKKGIK